MSSSTVGRELGQAMRDVVEAVRNDQVDRVLERQLGLASAESLTDSERRMADIIGEMTAIVRRFTLGEEPLLSRTLPQLQALAEKIRNRTI